MAIDQPHYTTLEENQEVARLDKDPQQELEKAYAKQEWLAHSFAKEFMKQLYEKQDNYFQMAIAHSQVGENEKSRWALASANCIDEIIEMLTKNQS